MATPTEDHILFKRWERVPGDEVCDSREWAWSPSDRQLKPITLSGAPTKHTTRMATPGKDRSARMDNYSDSDPAEEG